MSRSQDPCHHTSHYDHCEAVADAVLSPLLCPLLSQWRRACLGGAGRLLLLHLPAGHGLGHCPGGEGGGGDGGGDCVPGFSTAGTREDTWLRSPPPRRSLSSTPSSRTGFLTGLGSPTWLTRGPTGGRRRSRWRTTPTGPPLSLYRAAGMIETVSGNVLTKNYPAGMTWAVLGLHMRVMVRCMLSVKLTYDYRIKSVLHKAHVRDFFL